MSDDSASPSLQPIHIRTIPHHLQRYPTVGDYYTHPNGVRQLQVSAMGNPDYEFLVALHELIESHLVQKRGIPDSAIDEFDMWYERTRTPGDQTEPGDDPGAPYRREHQFATVIERLVAHELGVDWWNYERKVNSL